MSVGPRGHPAGLACKHGPGADAATAGGPRAARGGPVDLRARLPGSDAAGCCSRRTSWSSSCSATRAWRTLGALELPDTAPVVTGEIPAPPGAPTVLLYSHYDVVPAGDESKWESPPFEATERDGAIFGRGSADSKSNIIMHVGALRAWDGQAAGRHQARHRGPGGGRAARSRPTRRPHPELFAADAMVIADMGSVRPGVADADGRAARHGDA